MCVCVCGRELVIQRGEHLDMFFLVSCGRCHCLPVCFSILLVHCVRPLYILALLCFVLFFSFFSSPSSNILFNLTDSSNQDDAQTLINKVPVMSRNIRLQAPPRYRFTVSTICRQMTPLALVCFVIFLVQSKLKRTSNKVGVFSFPQCFDQRINSRSKDYDPVPSKFSFLEKTM